MSNTDTLRSRLLWGSAPSDEQPVIEPLTPQNARDLRLPWLSRFNASTLTAHLVANPGMALWVPRTGEYALAEPWRRRSDIAQIAEVTARKGKAALVRALTERLREQGNRMVLLSDDVWRDQSKLYADLGFAPIERIVFFQRNLPNGECGMGNAEYNSIPHLQYHVCTLHDLELLLQLDHASFPWLWWNSRDEFEAYLQMPGVHVYSASYEGQPVGYASYTICDGWAHLDRLAVIESHQGRKFGAAQLLHSLNHIIALGARSVSLSTQQTNAQSHRLYEGFGFRQTRDHMDMYGMRLDS